MAIAALSAEGLPSTTPVFRTEARVLYGTPYCSCASVKLSPHQTARLRLTGTAKSTRDQQGLLQMAVNSGIDGCRIGSANVTTLELSLSPKENSIATCEEHGLYHMFEAAFTDLHATLTCGGTVMHAHIATVVLPTPIVQRAFVTTLRASQERTSDVDAAVSVVSATRLEAERFLLDNPDFCTNHIALITLSAWFGSVVASNRAHVISREVVTTALAEEPVEVYAGCGQVVATRLPLVKPTEEAALRGSVEVVGHTAKQIEQDEQARDQRPKEVLQSVDRVIGPFIFEATTSIDAHTLEAELSGVQRHLNLKKQLEYRPENLQWLERAEIFVHAQLAKRMSTAHPHSVTLPHSWSDTLTEVVTASVGEERVDTLKGFSKPREVGLPEDKPARLIGTEGPHRAGENAEFVSPVEKAWKECFPGAVTKGLTVDALDELFQMRLGDARRRKRGIYSCDFSAMDSTWQLHEKRAVLRLIRTCVESMLGGMYAADFDRLMMERDVRCSQEKIKWRLKFVDVLVSAIDALLFSGERLTSLGNRFLVVLLRTAELLRLKGEEAAELYWTTLAGITQELFDIGDGDDTAFEECGEYIDAKDVVHAYEGYAKHIEPVYSTDSLEVLSRYTLAVKNGYVHLAKLNRNAGRTVFQSFQRKDLESPAGFTADEHREIATALLFRAYAMKHTLVLRYYALALARFHMRGHEGTAPIVVERLGARGEQVAVSAVGQQDTLREFYLEVRDVLAASRTSGFSMVRLVHDGKLMPDAATIKRMGWEWQSSDEALRELEICDDDFTAPDSLIDRMALKPCVVAALKIRARLAPSFAEPAVPERVEVLCPGHVPARHLEPPPGLMAPESTFSRSDERRVQRKQQHCVASRVGKSYVQQAGLPKAKVGHQRRVSQRNSGGSRDKTISVATDS
jgi:hypothetical protein